MALFVTPLRRGKRLGCRGQAAVKRLDERGVFGNPAPCAIDEGVELLEANQALKVGFHSFSDKKKAPVPGPGVEGERLSRRMQPPWAAGRPGLLDVRRDVIS